MRYRFVDETISLTLDGVPRIEVAKRFDPDDDAFRGPAGSERVPESMLLELMAMTGGQLIARHLGGSRLPMLLKIHECRFDGDGRAGERLRAVAELGGVTAPSDGPAASRVKRPVRQRRQPARLPPIRPSLRR